MKLKGDSDMSHVRYIEFRGEQRPLREVALQYNIDYATIFFRYRRGLRDDDLVREPDKTGLNPTYYIEGKPHRMTPSEKVKRTKSKVTVDEVQARLDLGMSMDEALSFSKRHVAKFGHLCYELHGSDVTYYIPIEDIQELRENDISTHYLSRNVMTVDDISELVLETTRVYEEDPYFDSINDRQRETQRIREKVQEYKDTKYREEHPHLFNGTPQTHEWGDYAEYLAGSYTFSCSQHSKEDINNEN